MLSVRLAEPAFVNANVPRPAVKRASMVVSAVGLRVSVEVVPCASLSTKATFAGRMMLARVWL